MTNNHNHSRDLFLTTSGIAIRIASLVPPLQIAMKVVEEIHTLSVTSCHNKEFIQQIEDRVELSCLLLAEVNLPEKRCQQAYEKYNKVLTQIQEYVKELRKPGKFSKRFLRNIFTFFSAKEIQTLQENYITMLDNAIAEFGLALDIDNNEVVHQFSQKLSEQSHRLTSVHADVMLIQKGIETPEAQLKTMRLCPEWIHDEDDEEPKIRGKRGQIKRRWNGIQEVAVKEMQIPEEEKEGGRKAIEEYAFFMSRLSGCDNIEKFYGTLLINHTLCVVTEWAEEGDLQDFLRSDRELLWPLRLKIAEQIANALEFINRAEIYHHDVRSRNVLLNKNLEAKLTGFDTSRFHKNSTTSNTQNINSMRWKAPEKLKPGDFIPYNKKCEVYSFSIVLWEIGTRKMPYEDKDDYDVANYVLGGGRPNLILTGAPLEYVELMIKGWSNNSDSRPPIEDMRKTLHKLTKPCKKGDSSSSLMTERPNDSTLSMSQPAAVLALASGHDKSLPFHKHATAVQELTNTENQEQSPLPQLEDVIKLHIDKKYSEAFPLFKRHAPESAVAKFYCGYYLCDGKHGVAKDQDSAIEYLRQAADAGLLKAQTLYAKMCLQPGTYDPLNGIKYLKMAVNHDHRPALEMWAEILYDGDHDQEMDPETAIELWKKAAKLKSKVAEEKLKWVEENRE